MTLSDDDYTRLETAVIEMHATKDKLADLHFGLGVMCGVLAVQSAADVGVEEAIAQMKSGTEAGAEIAESLLPVIRSVVDTQARRRREEAERN